MWRTVAMGIFLGGLIGWLYHVLQGNIILMLVWGFVMVAGLGLAGLYLVPMGYEAVVRDWDKSAQMARGPIIWIIPGLQQVESIFSRGTRFTRTTVKDVVTNGGITVEVNATVLYTLDLSPLNQIQRAHMAGMTDLTWELVIREAFDNCIRDVMAAATPYGAVLCDRDQVKQDVITILQQKFGPLGINILDVWLHEVVLPGEYQAATVERERIKQIASAKQAQYEAYLKTLSNSEGERVHALAHLMLADGVGNNEHSPTTFVNFPYGPPPPSAPVTVASNGSGASTTSGQAAPHANGSGSASNGNQPQRRLK